MSLLSAIMGGSYIEIVKKYIEKIFVHEAKLFDHSDEDFDLIIRKVNGQMRMFIYSRRTQTLLRELSDKEAEQILTS
jgi:hypothetical protein